MHSLVWVNTFNKAAYISAALAVFLGLQFVYYFTGRRRDKQLQIAWIVTLIVLALSASRYIAGEATASSQGISFSAGPLVGGYAVFLCSLLLLIGIELRGAIRTKKGAEAEQARLILAGFVLTTVLGIVFNVVIPTLSSNWSSTSYGPMLSIILVSSIAYAIVKHRLFDIRLILARSFAYALALLTIGCAFVAFTYVTSQELFSNHGINNEERFLYAVFAVALALLFSSIKRAFDKLTNRIFFRDAYDPQDFLDEINKVLVTTFELEALLQKSSFLIAGNIKPTYTVFGIKETAHTPRRILGSSGHPTFKENDIEMVRKMTPAFKNSLIITDTLEGENLKLKRLLQSYDIALIARLALVKDVEGIGYLILGPKKNGSLYNAQDLRIVQIIANELAIAIQNALRFEEIKNFNLTLQGKIDEATKQLRRANEKLKQLDETKDDFISMASHQLRTPLTSVKGYLSMVLEGDAGKISPMQKEMLGQAFFSSQRMVYIIADLLNVSRLKTGKFVIDPVKVNLADVIQEELEQVEEMAAAKQLTLQYDKPKDFPPLMLDDTKTRQVIMNFVDNAIYYTPSGGHITVSLIDKPHTVELRVEDNGIGVPKREQPHLFTKFYRAGNARKARPDGTGLGLFMAKKVVVAQGGSILFESQENKGSMFGFVLSKSHSSNSLNNTPPTSVKTPIS